MQGTMMASTRLRIPHHVGWKLRRNLLPLPSPASSSFLSQCWSLINILHPKLHLSICFWRTQVMTCAKCLAHFLAHRSSTFKNIIIIIIIPNELKSKTAYLFSIWSPTIVLRLGLLNLIHSHTLSCSLSLSLFLIVHVDSFSYSKPWLNTMGHTLS